jgi:hypothetical protein
MVGTAPHRDPCHDHQEGARRVGTRIRLAQPVSPGIPLADQHRAITAASPTEIQPVLDTAAIVVTVKGQRFEFDLESA